MTDLTPEQIAARQRNGKFGVHSHSGPELALGNAYRDVTSPLTVCVQLEAHDGYGDPQELETIEFDARALFDGRSLADIRTASTADARDWVFFEAQSVGLVDDHDGPFTVKLPADFREYIEHRENNGMVEPYETAAESLALQVREVKLGKRRNTLAAAARLLQEAGDGATITKKVHELEAGDVLVRGEYRTRVESVLEHGDFETRVSNGFESRYAVDTDFGTILLDENDTVQVEAD